MTLNDFELFKRWFFFLFLAAAHILRVNCGEMAGDRPRQPAYEIFGIKCNFSNLNLDSLSLRRPAGKHQKEVLL